MVQNRETQAHENVTSFRTIEASSDRNFGLIVGILLTALSLLPFLLHHRPVRSWLLGLGVILVGLGLVAPHALAPLNRLWFRLGLLLAKVTNPIVMGVLFFGVLWPIGAFLRLRGKDLLRLKRDADASTYWMDRDPDTATMPTSRQF